MSIVLQVFAESLTGYLLSAAAAHTFTNGRARYSQQTDQRRERAEERGEVCNVWHLHCQMYTVTVNIISSESGVTSGQTSIADPPLQAMGVSAAYCRLCFSEGHNRSSLDWDEL